MKFNFVKNVPQGHFFLDRACTPPKATAPLTRLSAVLLQRNPPPTIVMGKFTAEEKKLSAFADAMPAVYLFIL